MATENEYKKWKAEDYLGGRSVHSLFEHLTAELILHKPNAPVEYMIQRLQQMKDDVTPTRPSLIFVLGPPGSGRGTQCAKLVDKFGFKHIVASDVLRNEVVTGSEQGRIVESVMREGDVVPGDIALIKKALEAHADATTFLIDGFPMEMAQALAFEADVCECRFVLHLECSEDSCKQRLAHREKLLKNPIDSPAMVEKRLASYKRECLPVVQYFEALGKVRRINADGGVDQVWKELELLFMPTPL